MLQLPSSFEFIISHEAEEGCWGLFCHFRLSSGPFGEGEKSALFIILKQCLLKSFFSDRVSISAFEGLSKELLLKC